ncbi:hypothetical protein DBR42_18555, partial [Pelomonas sp. HMWF004]
MAAVDALELDAPGQVLGIDVDPPIAGLARDRGIDPAELAAAHLQRLAAQRDLAGQQAGVAVVAARGHAVASARGGCAQLAQALLPGVQVQRSHIGLQQHTGSRQGGQLVLHGQHAAQHARAAGGHIALQLSLKQRCAGGAHFEANLVAAAAGGRGQQAQRQR